MGTSLYRDQLERRTLERTKSELPATFPIGHSLPILDCHEFEAVSRDWLASTLPTLWN